MTRCACVLAVGALAVLSVSCGKPPAQTSAPPPPPSLTNTAPPGLPPQPELPESVATIKGSAEIPVTAPQTGFLVRQTYKEGAMVAAGDTLFLLDPRISHDNMPAGKAGDSSLVKIIATAIGVPGRPLHGPGDHVDAGEEVAAISQIDNVIAELVVPDALAQKFISRHDSPELASHHQAIEMILPDGSIYPTHGVVANVITSGSVNTMEISFPNPTRLLQPGEFVKVRSVAP